MLRSGDAAACSLPVGSCKTTSQARPVGASPAPAGLQQHTQQRGSGKSLPLQSKAGLEEPRRSLPLRFLKVPADHTCHIKLNLKMELLKRLKYLMGDMAFDAAGGREIQDLDGAFVQAIGTAYDNMGEVMEQLVAAQADYSNCLGKGAFGEVWDVGDGVVKEFYIYWQNIVNGDGLMELAMTLTEIQLPLEHALKGVVTGEGLYIEEVELSPEELDCDGLAPGETTKIKAFLHLRKWEGGNLGTWVSQIHHSGSTESDRLVPLGELASVFTDVLGGVCEMHENHMVHSDIKLANCLLKEDRNGAKIGGLADLGSTCARSHEDGRYMASACTLASLSPQFRWRRDAYADYHITPPDDVFSWAIALLEAVFGWYGVEIMVVNPFAFWAQSFIESKMAASSNTPTLEERCHLLMDVLLAGQATQTAQTCRLRKRREWLEEECHPQAVRVLYALLRVVALGMMPEDIRPSAVELREEMRSIMAIIAAEGCPDLCLDNHLFPSTGEQAGALFEYEQAEGRRATGPGPFDMDWDERCAPSVWEPEAKSSLPSWFSSCSQPSAAGQAWVMGEEGKEEQDEEAEQGEQEPELEVEEGWWDKYAGSWFATILPLELSATVDPVAVLQDERSPRCSNSCGSACHTNSSKGSASFSKTSSTPTAALMAGAPPGARSSVADDPPSEAASHPLAERPSSTSTGRFAEAPSRTKTAHLAEAFSSDPPPHAEPATLEALSHVEAPTHAKAPAAAACVLRPATAPLPVTAPPCAAPAFANEAALVEVSDSLTLDPHSHTTSTLSGFRAAGVPGNSRPVQATVVSRSWEHAVEVEVILTAGVSQEDPSTSCPPQGLGHASAVDPDPCPGQPSEKGSRASWWQSDAVFYGGRGLMYGAGVGIGLGFLLGLASSKVSG